MNLGHVESYRSQSDTIITANISANLTGLLISQVGKPAGRSFWYAAIHNDRLPVIPAGSLRQGLEVVVVFQLIV